MHVSREINDALFYWEEKIMSALANVTAEKQALIPMK